MLLQIKYYGNPILRKRCEPVEKIDDELRQFIQDMIETMDANSGIGLAAPQVGRPIRLFVARGYIELEDNKWAIIEPKAYINPKLTILDQTSILDTEGCLSIPGIRGQVERPLKLHIEALDENGQSFTQEFEGYNARIRMHENDHINGVLFVDRLPIHERNKLEPLLREIKKKYK